MDSRRGTRKLRPDKIDLTARGAAKAAPLVMEVLVRKGYTMPGMWSPEIERAWGLLWRDLNTAQREEVVLRGEFDVHMEVSGGFRPSYLHTFRFILPHQHNIGCINPPNYLPWPDRLLAVKKWLELAPDEVFATANQARYTSNAHMARYYDSRRQYQIANDSWRLPYKLPVVRGT